jgi:hypothetical protein
MKNVVRLVAVDALRGTDEALTTKDITLRVMTARDLNAADPRLVRTVQRRVGAALRHVRPSGGARCERSEGGACVWKLPA